MVRQPLPRLGQINGCVCAMAASISGAEAVGPGNGVSHLLASKGSAQKPCKDTAASASGSIAGPVASSKAGGGVCPLLMSIPLSLDDFQYCRYIHPSPGHICGRRSMLSPPPSLAPGSCLAHHYSRSKKGWWFQGGVATAYLVPTSPGSWGRVSS